MSMDLSINPNGIPIIGQNRILLTLVPGNAFDTFDINVDTSNFAPGIPLAVQCLLQAAISLIPQAYEVVLAAGKQL